jgi:hypothetical protein
MKQVDVAKMCNAMVPMDDPFSEIIVMNIIVICKLINMSSCYCTIPVRFHILLSGEDRPLISLQATMQWFTVCLLVSIHDSTLSVILLSKQYQNKMNKM